MSHQEELDILFSKRKREKEEGKPMNMKPLITMVTTAILTLCLILAANFAINRFEGDPLKEIYEQNPDVYGPDMAALYAKRNQYCRPWWVQKLIAGVDAGTCMQKERELADYTSRVLYAARSGTESVKDVKSNSFDVLANVYANGNKFRQEQQAKREEAAE